MLCELLAEVNQQGVLIIVFIFLFCVDSPYDAERLIFNFGVI